ncbi:SCP2 sterol-binding domain-containing protein [Limibaculum sp. M0105]|uniref:SCP2 sterol-binding domain-containing protein n=1 Tax=Thermohalobaculum xanthum TaxID=2753746 RepID=A0A8J7MAB5_9RHOB|nr:SCP2 sterol-binding domain-containing protein [Thermohalobaculum xanthum]MBK0401151.1 SCP2 sterol-binding domain-containing protein [Thermohalobaculum xanthum]
MSKDIDAAAEALREKFAASDFSGSVKFEVEGEGVILVRDGEVSTSDGDADVTISASLDTFRAMFEGDLSPTSAYMTGKIRIDGDMGAAMKLSQIL